MPVTNRTFDDVDYALVVAPVLSTLRGAFDSEATVDLLKLARTYRHQPESDLHRVKLHELGDVEAEDIDAKLWLFQAVCRAMSPWIALDDTVAALKDGATPDDLRFQGRPIPAQEVDKNKLQHPFSRQHDTGDFADNIRAKVNPKKLEELRESMREFGWIDHHPAILDENNVIIVGHRRMMVAKELGIEPKVVRIKFGYGDAGDAERIRLAIASNLGNDPLNTEDRRKIAGRLLLEKNDKGDPAWSVRAIAKILNVAKSTIHDDRKALMERERAKEEMRKFAEQLVREPVPVMPPAPPVKLTVVPSPEPLATVHVPEFVPTPEKDLPRSVHVQETIKGWLIRKVNALPVDMTRTDLENFITEATDYFASL